MLSPTCSKRASSLSSWFLASFPSCFSQATFLLPTQTVQLLMQVRSADLFSVEAQYFVIIMTVQTQAAFLLNCWVGPVLIAET